MSDTPDELFRETDETFGPSRSQRHGEEKKIRKQKVERSRVQKSRRVKMKVDTQKASKSRILGILSPNLQSPPKEKARK